MLTTVATQPLASETDVDEATEALTAQLASNSNLSRSNQTVASQSARLACVVNSSFTFSLAATSPVPSHEHLAMAVETVLRDADSGSDVADIPTQSSMCNTLWIVLPCRRYLSHEQ